MDIDTEINFYNLPITAEDSYNAFAEALEIARDRDVDFVLLGGDLFHVSRPSASVEHRCIQILRHHMNAKGTSQRTSLRRISGKFCHYDKVDHPNFEDPHLTVACPIMTIHGNHDDLTGPQNQSVCEKLATCGLLNYFGLPKATDKAKITIEPIVLQKNSIKIALYGLGFMADSKLKLAFERDEVHFKSPSEDTFNVLVVHQNRVCYDEAKHIPDDLFPGFFHLIIRGHEHDFQKPEAHSVSKVNGLVYQPGSTVATSIASKEGGNKFVGLMEVKVDDPSGSPDTMFKLNYDLIELKSCRKMLFCDIPQKSIFNYIKSACGAAKLTPVEYRHYSMKHVEMTIRKMLKEYYESDETEQSPSARSLKKIKKDPKMKPLLRVRLEFVSKSERFNESEISQQFYPNEVANQDIVMFKKQVLVQGEDGAKENVTFNCQNVDEEEVDEFEFVDLSTEKRDTIESALSEYFLDKPLDERLKVLSIEEYIDAIRGSQEDGNIISKVVKTKKQEVLHMFYSELTNEMEAGEKYHNIQSVERWFLDKFRDPSLKQGGDAPSQIEVVDLRDVEEMGDDW